MNIYFYSASTNQFYPTVLLDAYRANGVLPDDFKPVDDDMALEFLGVPPAAIVHLSLKVAEISNADKKEFADSYRKTANLLAETTRNREIIAMTLNQIANGMDSSHPAGPRDISDEIRDMLH